VTDEESNVNSSGASFLRCVVVLLMVLTPILVPAQMMADEKALRAVFQEQEAAWNRGDGVGFAAAFADDSDFINVRGDLFHGKTMIAARHTSILSGPFKGSHDTITIRNLRTISPELVIVETDHSLTEFHSLPPGIGPTFPGTLKTHMTYVVSRKEGGWSIVFAQNTAVASAPLAPVGRNDKR
jgi:uncharacterized protein (TIGR02246 family)